MDSKTILRRNYQKKFDALKKVMIEIPPQGWLKTIRDFLGMTTSQLAKRVGVSQPRVFTMEKKIRLKLLQITAWFQTAAGIREVESTEM